MGDEPTLETIESIKEEDTAGALQKLSMQWD